MALVECTFNSSNGNMTAVNVRSGPGTSYGIVGTIIKKNYKTVTLDTSVSGGNSWFKLHNPESYGIQSNGKTLYCRAVKSWILKPDPSTITPDSSSSSTSTSNTPATTEEIKDAATKQTSSGLDSIYTSMLKSGYGINKLDKMSRIIGMPYHFTNETDYRPYANDGLYLGRKFLENIIHEAPIISLVPGIPSYLPELSEEDKTTFGEYVQSATNGALLSDDVKTKIMSQDARYFGFKANYAKYIRYVNMLCRQCSIYMGIGDETVPGTTEKYKSYDWGKWMNMNYESKSSGKYNVWDRLDSKDDKEEDKDNVGFVTNLLESIDSMASELYDDYKYVRCYVEANASFSEDNSNNTSSSKIAGLFDTLEGLAKEGIFLAEDSTFWESVKSSVGTLASSATGTAVGDDGPNSNISKLVSSATHILTGSNVIFPDMWSDSSYSKSYSFSLNLISPYGDNESIFLNIIVPMMFMIALSAPRQTGPNTYGSPFLVKAFAKGWFSCEMGIIDSIRIEKGGDGTAWNIYGFPTEVKISLSIRDLYTNLMITSSTQPSLYFQNQGLIEFLAVTCGVDISTTHLLTKIQSYINTYITALTDIPSNIIDNFIQSLRNKTEGLWKIGGF